MNDSVISHALKGLIKFVSVTRLNVDEIYSRLGKVEGSVEDLDIPNAYDLSEIRDEVENASTELRAEIEDMTGTVEAMESSISDLESAQDYFDLGEFDQFTDLATDVRGNAEELSLQEHRIGSIETKLEAVKELEPFSGWTTIKNAYDELSTEIGVLRLCMGSIETKLDGEVVSIKDLATRLNRLEQRPYWDKDTESIEAQITDAIHKLYEMHGMEMDFGCCLAAKGGDDE